MGQVKFFKGCLPQILLGSFLNTLSHMLPPCNRLHRLSWNKKFLEIFLYPSNSRAFYETELNLKLCIVVFGL